jgi:hypothetical protein
VDDATGFGLGSLYTNCRRGILRQTTNEVDLKGKGSEPGRERFLWNNVFACGLDRLSLHDCHGHQQSAIMSQNRP